MRGIGIFVAAGLMTQLMAGTALAQTTAGTTPTTIPATAAAPALPPPSQQVLQPVPAETATAPAVAPAAVATPAVPGAPAVPANGTVAAPAPALTKEQQNQAAVQAILSEQVRKVAPPVPGAPPALSASDLLAQGVIVTPAAKDVINVHNIKKGAAANTDRAIYAAADRAFTEGQYATAVDLYDRILNRSPSNKVALYGKALSLHKAGRTEEALKIYERLSLLDPTNVNATANYMSLLRQSDPQRALSRLQNLEQTYPNRPALQGQIGMVYAQMNDTPDAVRAFNRATALDPNNPVYPFNLGVLYDRMGNDQKAGQYYSTALKNAGDNPGQAKNVPVESIRERLKSLDF